MRTQTITVTEDERKFLILCLRHMQECACIPVGYKIRPLAFMVSNKLFGRGYKSGDWNRHMKKLINEKIKEFEPTWNKLKKVK